VVKHKGAWTVVVTVGQAVMAGGRVANVGLFWVWARTTGRRGRRVRRSCIFAKYILVEQVL
jgi:hypothetical protein